jgi:shikimate kinase
MGAGKTVVGQWTASLLGWEFVDLDDIIVQTEGQSIASLFANAGEAAFRQREHAALTRTLPRTSMVLSLGGGALETQANRDLLYSTPGTCVVFLEAPLEVLRARCEAQALHRDAPVRPVMALPANWEQRYHQRLPYYKMAHHTVPTADRSPEQVARAVLAAVFFPLRTGTSQG